MKTDINVNIMCDNHHKRGEHKTIITAILTFEEDCDAYQAASHLELFFNDLPENAQCNSCTWGRMNGKWDAFLNISRTMKYKSDHMNAAEILGHLTHVYGDLETYIRDRISFIVSKKQMIERAKSAMRSAEHVGNYIADTARKKAMANINYEERFKKLKEELRLEIGFVMIGLLDKEDWKYEGGEDVDPVAVKLIKAEQNRFEENAMPSRFPSRRHDYLFNEYAAPWLASVIEGMEEQ